MFQLVFVFFFHFILYVSLKQQVSEAETSSKLNMTFNDLFDFHKKMKKHNCGIIGLLTKPADCY